MTKTKLALFVTSLICAGILYGGITAASKTPPEQQQVLVDPECSVIDIVTLDNRLIDVQPDDIFYLTASGPEGEKGVTVDLDDGTYGMVVRTGSRLPVSYGIPGTYIIHGSIGGEHLKPIRVRVIAPPKDVLKDQPSVKGKTTTLMTMSTSSGPTIGGSVGSVYAGSNNVVGTTNLAGKFPVRIVVQQAGTFTLTKYGGGWSQDWYFLSAGEKTDVIDGPKGSESPWTLIKSGGGTHVLSPNSPSKLKINDILMHSGPTYVAQPRAKLSNSNIYLAVDTPLVLVVDPGPGWASNNTPRTDQLYEWKIDTATAGSSVSNTFNFSSLGTYQVSVSCRSPSTTPVTQSLTINVGPKVDFIRASSAVADNTPQVFVGSTTDFGDPCSGGVSAGQALIVFYDDVVGGYDSVDNQLVADFDVNLHAEVSPATVTPTDLSEVWMQTVGPVSGFLNINDTFDVKFQNPKKGGLYKFEFSLGIPGSPVSGANLLLPLAGAESRVFVTSEVARITAWVDAQLPSIPLVNRLLAILMLRRAMMVSANLDYGPGHWVGGNSPCRRYSLPGAETLTVDGIVMSSPKLANMMWGVLCKRFMYWDWFANLGADIRNRIDNGVLSGDSDAAKASYELGRELSEDVAPLYLLMREYRDEIREIGGIEEKLFPSEDLLGVPPTLPTLP